MSLRQEHFEVSRPQSIEVRLPAGKISVVGEGEGEVIVEVDGRHSEEFTVSQSGASLFVHHEGRRSIGSASHDVYIKAPAGSSLAARVASADVTSGGRLRDVTVATASGDVALSSVDGDVDAKTASGRVSVEDGHGSIRVRTASGKIEIQRITGDLNGVTASGDVVVSDARGDVSVKTASGRIGVARFDGEVVNAKTVSGNVRVGIPIGRTVQVDLQSLSGRIDLPSEPDSGTGADRQIRVKAKTVSGNIAILSVEDVEESPEDDDAQLEDAP